MSNLFGVFLSYLLGLMAMTGYFLRNAEKDQEVMDRVRPFYGGIAILLFLNFSLTLYEMALAFEVIMVRLQQLPLVMLSIIQMVILSFLISALIAYDFLSVYIMNRTYASREKAKIGWVIRRPYLTLLGLLNIFFATLLLILGFLN